MTKKLLTAILCAIMFMHISGCAKPENGNGEQTPQDVDWSFYNERAEEFVTAIAGGDFDAAVAMFDSTMKRMLPAAKLQNDVWNVVLGQTGAFIGIHETENLAVDGYFISFITSEHENRGATLRVVFSENGLISGLYIDGYPTIAIEEAVQSDGFTNYPVIIGEGTDYPLDGILSIPDGVEGKLPAVVLVHGSGPNDMDETIFGNKPFRDVAEYLAKNGVAVIRYDKRTFTHGAALAQEFGGGLTVNEETIEDAILAAELLRSDRRIDEKRIFILGHSLGGMLAPRIHAEGGDFAGIISFAGSPRSLLDISYDQQMAYIAEMPEGAEKTASLAQMETYFYQIDVLLSLSDDEAKATQVSGGVYAYYFKEMDGRPAAGYISEISVPFLIMQGSKDFQVFADTDFVMWQELLEGRENVTFKLYDGLNHLFMASADGSITDFQEEYKVAGNVDPQVLADIVAWVNTISD